MRILIRLRKNNISIFIQNTPDCRRENIQVNLYEIKVTLESDLQNPYFIPSQPLFCRSLNAENRGPHFVLLVRAFILIGCLYRFGERGSRNRITFATTTSCFMLSSLLAICPKNNIVLCRYIVYSLFFMFNGSFMEIGAVQIYK